MGLLDFIFPKRCVACKSFGSYLCADCFSFLSFSQGGFCLICNKASIDSLTHPGCHTRYAIDGAFASLVYAGVMKRLVYTFKYKPYLTDLQSVLIDLFYEGIIQNETFHKVVNKKALFVPIPLFSAKLRSRGYNQAEILSTRLAKRLGLTSANLLQRTRNTSSQFRLSRKERQENISRAFSPISKNRVQIEGKELFLVDDVVTSGATLVEAAKVLKRGGAKAVFGLALAHGQ
ncbi:MAG: ComF family protein [Candidatus Levybacteria bacterium]|nr:ComF family protein [Candidatus Levybacteria bacterium]